MQYDGYCLSRGLGIPQLELLRASFYKLSALLMLEDLVCKYLSRLGQKAHFFALLGS